MEDVACEMNSLAISNDGPCYADVPEKYSKESKVISAARARVFHPPDWGWATLTKNKRVTAEGWFQDVREFELELESGV